jgi:hypothetical protein
MGIGRNKYSGAHGGGMMGLSAMAINYCGDKNKNLADIQYL